jgi:hypothetical protein
MAFYSATNPIVLIEFIDIKDISNPEASPNRPGDFKQVLLFQPLARVLEEAGSLRCAAVFHLAVLFWSGEGDES